eukprot:9937_1
MPRRFIPKTTHPNHVWWLQQAKGFRGRSKNCYSLARRAVEKSWVKQYVDRKHKKRNARTSWVMSLEAACKEQGLLYPAFIHGLRLSNIYLNRKMLAEMAVHEPQSFRSLILKSIEAAQKHEKLRRTRQVGLHVKPEWDKHLLVEQEQMKRMEELGLD